MVISSSRVTTNHCLQRMDSTSSCIIVSLRCNKGVQTNEFSGVIYSGRFVYDAFAVSICKGLSLGENYKKAHGCRCGLRLSGTDAYRIFPWKFFR